MAILLLTHYTPRNTLQADDAHPTHRGMRTPGCALDLVSNKISPAKKNLSPELRVCLSILLNQISFSFRCSQIENEFG